MKICFATNNKNKLFEIKNKLGEAYEIISLSDLGHFEDLAETQDTLEGNSLQKARFVYDTYGVNCFADDSGLMVEALNGEPGVNSAFYAGEAKSSEANVALLLNNMRGINNRKARFVTVITLVLNGKVEQFRGEIDGSIAEHPSGSHGFGYDPVFVPDGWQCTFAEVDLQLKNKISHRARAVEQLVDFLK
ncbi:MAG: RdgB/HAM1 family non-canonical purine NTP pyrophosphatase [Cyclobacteriaceae bacterium]|nr:RdgB/HAM1 family non-canonical purine NTP pyrophosphatase [Cyclobacteriaceae bacterium]